MAKAITKSASNALNVPGQSLQTFGLLELQQYTKEKVYSTTASLDFHLFYVGRDDVHDILKYVLSRVTVSQYLNMFGYDDDELNQILMAKALGPQITMLIILDKSQSGGPHEKALLDSDIAKNPTAYNTHFVVGNSATGQISHTKGFVADGKVTARWLEKAPPTGPPRAKEHLLSPARPAAPATKRKTIPSPSSPTRIPSAALPPN